MPRPYRRPPPDHRWHRARRLVRRGKDLEPQWMAPFAVKVLPGGTRLTGAALATFTTAVKEAIELREAEDSTRRDDVEAWVLAGVELAEVARRTGIGVAVVTAYAQLFLDLAPWLADDLGRWELGYRLLGDKLDRGIEEADTGSWKRFAGLTGGPVVLERLLDYLKACPLIYPSDVSGMTDADLERLRDLLIVRHWVLTMAPLTTAAQQMRIEFVWALQEGQRIWPTTMR